MASLRLLMSSVRAILTLLSIKGVGRKYVQGFLQEFGPLESHEALVDAVERRRAKGKDRRLESHSISEYWQATEPLLQNLEDNEYTVLPIDSPHYPQRLAQISDPPVILFVHGNSSILNDDSVAIIGTREPTAFGEKAGQRIASTAVQHGFVVVSGLAIGCDTVAHLGCLDASGKTAAVLAHGFGHIYPKENADLALRIVESGGSLVSEYLPGTPATRGSFVERDRLQSGLSSGLIVVETGVKGGTLHTVGFALQQGRPVGAIDHPEPWRSADKAQGNQVLIAKGQAQPLSDSDAVQSFLSALRGGKVHDAAAMPESHPTVLLSSADLRSSAVPADKQLSLPF